MEWLKRILGGGETLVDWDQVLATADQTFEAMARPAVALDISPGAPVGAGAASSIGGAPGLPDGMDWPVDANGLPMLFLAQINYAEMPQIPEYPDHGVLSFWAENEDVLGCEFPSRNQQGFRTLYLQDAGGLARRALPEREEDWAPYGKRLLAEGVPITGRAVRARPGGGAKEFSAFADDWLNDCPREVADEIFRRVDDWRPATVYYGGFPDFVQQDIRRFDGNDVNDRVLLQMGFTGGERDWEICWGDAGEACFLIPRAALAARAFEKAIYSWDCG